MWDKRKIAFDKRKPIRRNFLGFGAVVAVKKDGVEEEHSLDARIATRNYWN